MSKRTVFDCDLCGKKDIDAIAFGFSTGREMCPSGNGGVDVYEVVDVCVGCAGPLLNEWCKQMDYCDAKAYLSRFTHRKK